MNFKETPIAVDQSQPPHALSHRLRLLWIGLVEPSWIGLALRLDAEGCVEPRFRWAANASEAMTILRDESFDCILICGEKAESASRLSHDPAATVQAVRGSGNSDPIICVTPEIDDIQQASLSELDCDTLVTGRSSDSPALLPLIRRAVANAERIRENHRLSVIHQRRMIRERNEAEQLLQQQQAIISRLEIALPGEPSQQERAIVGSDHRECLTSETVEANIELPEETTEFYQELLRTYVIMGSGSLDSEITGLARLIVAADISPRQALQFHLERVKSLVHNLGNRSARHVMARADLLALELVVQVGEEYQQRQAVSDKTPPTSP